MKTEEPSLEEWKNLYQAAVEFQKTGCWNWMWDTDIFGVQNPLNGEIGYCCVMGSAGEYYALGVYLGTEGLIGYLRIQSGEILPSSPDALHIQKCLMASFEDRKFLEKKDLDVIKSLNLTFRGHKSWPQFRSYSPGYFPWYLTIDEAKFLTLALNQTVEVSLRFKNNPELLITPEEDRFLVRVPKKKKDGFIWRDEYLKPDPPEEIEIVVESINTELLKRIRSTIKGHEGTWEIDFFYFTQPVKDKTDERPYYPYAVLWLDSDADYILNYSLARPRKALSELPNQFMKTVKNLKILPKEIKVKKEEIYNLLKPLTSMLGIKLNIVDRLRSLENAKAEMLERFNM